MGFDGWNALVCGALIGVTGLIVVLVLWVAYAPFWILDISVAG